MRQHNLPPLDPQKGDWDEDAISRRSFLTIGFWAVTGASSLVMGGAGARFLVGDSLEPKPEQWVEVGNIAELPVGEVYKTTYTIQANDAWREVEQKGLLYAFSNDSNDYTVLDATCTHLGCNVLWQQQTGRFVCPCHNGVFSREGEIISGPPPAALRQLQTKIQDGILLALI